MPVDLNNWQHRGASLPSKRWTWRMTWRHLLFAHWPIDPARLRSRIPDQLELDVRDGAAWIAVVPFDMHMRPRWAPALPMLTHFPELNVRTYVKYKGRPGVWFFSLDASLKLAVDVARKRFQLPYYHARMRCDVTQSEGATGPQPLVSYDSERIHTGALPAAFRARYQPTGAPEYAEPDSTAAWFTERYCLFSQGRDGRIGKAEIHHDPWPLQPAAWEVKTNAMLAPLALPLPAAPPVLHYVDHLDVVAWPLEWMD